MSHHYKLQLRWTGNRGTGTSDYRAYDRNHTVTFGDKPELKLSADPTFRGDPTMHNPEELLLAAVSGCHLMSFLHVCVTAGVIVLDYEDNATGTMVVNTDGSGHFTGVTLNPVVTIDRASKILDLDDLHRKANKLCFIANSVNFPVHHHAAVKVIP